MSTSAWRALRVCLLAALALAATAAVLAGGASASLTPPINGDWTILTTEAADLEGVTAVVTGNITVQGSLRVGNGSLLLSSGGEPFIPRIQVDSGASLVLFNATLAGNAANRYVIEAYAGSSIAANGSTFSRMAEIAVGGLTGVGMALHGASISLENVVISDSIGGIGMDAAGTLTATGLYAAVDKRALFLSGNSTGDMTNFVALGNPTSSDFLVVVDQSNLHLYGGNFSMAQVGLLVLSGTADVRAMDVGPIYDIGVLAVGSTVNWSGGKMAPARNDTEGFEAYGSQLNISTSVYNATFGAVLVESNATFWQFSFEASGASPKGSTAGVYAFDSHVTVIDSNISGRYWVNSFQLFDINGTPVQDPPGVNVTIHIFACSTSAVWAVHSVLTVERSTTFCFNTHIWSLDSQAYLAGLDLTNGTTGVLIQGGSVSGGNVTGRLFNNSGSSAILVAIYKATGSIVGVESFGNDAAVDFVGSDLQMDGVTVHAPGTAIRVWSGAPTINASTFFVENHVGIEVRGGNPTISNTTIHVLSTTQEARAMIVVSGHPTMYRNFIDGNYVFSIGVRTEVTGFVTVRETTFTRLQRAAQMYSTGFLLEGNRVDRCYYGFESGEGAAGTIRGNLFTNMTDIGLGFPVRIYRAAVVVEANTFRGANYGVQITNHNTTGTAITRVTSNTFDTIVWFAVQSLFSTRAVLIDNNTMRNTTAGAVELVRAPASAAYNVIFDGDYYGYSANASSLTIVGDRLENNSRAVDIIGGSLDVHFSTFARNGIGIFSQDAAVRVHNSSFQFNGIAVEIVNSVPNEIVDTLFVNNGDAIYTFGYGTLDLRDTSFVGTVGMVLSNQQYTTTTFTYSRRGEISGGHIILAGVLEARSEALTLRDLEMRFGPLAGGQSGVLLEGVSELVMDDVHMSDSQFPYFFEVRNSTGTMALVSVRGAQPRSTSGYQAPFIDNSVLSMRDSLFNESDGNMTLRYSTVTAANLTIRDMNGTSIVLEGSTLNVTNAAFLDGVGCGIDARASSVLTALNLTVRGNDGGSLCFNASRATVVKGDFASGGPRDVLSHVGSDILLVSTLFTRGYQVTDTSRLTISWVLDVRVAYANAQLLPLVSVTIQDARGLVMNFSPNITGHVQGIPYLPQYVISATTTVVRTPYSVGAGHGPLFANANVSLDRDRFIELSLNDSTAPTVAILAPASGAFFDQSQLNFSFQASDGGSAVRELLYRFGAGSSVALNPSAGSYNVTRFLVDGQQSFTVRATDFAGNVREVSVNFTVDTLAPLITVVSPRPDPYLTRSTNVTVQVAVDSDVAVLTIGGENVSLSSGGASLTLNLFEGETRLEVVATDYAGNVARVRVTVIADRTPPPLEISNRPDSNITAESYIIVRGNTEVGALVIVQGYPVATEAGAFEALVYLDIGHNEIEVRARDALGNENTTRLAITRGVLEPSHVLDLVISVIGAVLLIAAAVVAVLTIRRGLQGPPPSGGSSGSSRAPASAGSSGGPPP